MRQPLLRYAPLLLLALAWEIGARTGLVSTLALPPLSTVIAAWIELLKDGELVTNGAASLWRAGAGLFLSIVIGAALGIFMAWWRPVNVLLSPLVEMFYPMPKSALIPVTVLWLGFGNGSKILLIFLGCMLPVTIGAFNGARSSEQALVWSARSMGANRLRMLWDVVVPSAMPELLNGIRTALALSFILLVSSELIAAREGLGYLIGFLGASGTYDAMFAVVLTVALLGFIADRIYLVAHAKDAAVAGIAQPPGGPFAELAREPLRATSSLNVNPRPLFVGSRPGWAIARVVSILALALAWELAARSGAFTPFMLPALSAVLERIWNDLIAGELLLNTAVTLYRALAGFLIGAVAGIVLGMAHFPQRGRQLVLRSDHLGRFPDAEDRLPAGGHPLARRLRHLQDHHDRRSRRSSPSSPRPSSASAASSASCSGRRATWARASASCSGRSRCRRRCRRSSPGCRWRCRSRSSSRS